MSPQPARRRRGRAAAPERLTEKVYPELRLMARRYLKNERPNHSLPATALVHEVYLRLVDVSRVEWRERAQFFDMAAQMMRRILVSAARARGFAKTRRRLAKREHRGDSRFVRRAGPVNSGR